MCLCLIKYLTKSTNHRLLGSVQACLFTVCLASPSDLVPTSNSRAIHSHLFPGYISIAISMTLIIYDNIYFEDDVI